MGQEAGAPPTGIRPIWIQMKNYELYSLREDGADETSLTALKPYVILDRPRLLEEVVKLGFMCDWNDFKVCRLLRLEAQASIPGSSLSAVRCHVPSCSALCSQDSYSRDRGLPCHLMSATSSPRRIRISAFGLPLYLKCSSGARSPTCRAGRWGTPAHTSIRMRMTFDVLLRPRPIWSNAVRTKYC